MDQNNSEYGHFSRSEWISNSLENYMQWGLSNIYKMESFAKIAAFSHDSRLETFANLQHQESSI